MSFWCYKLENGELIKSLYRATVADTVKNACRFPNNRKNWKNVDSRQFEPSRQFYIIKIKTKSTRQNFAVFAPICMSLCKRTTSSRITSLELVTPKRQGLAYLMTMSNIIINAHTFWNFICTYLLYASLFNIEKFMNKKVSAFYLHQILIIVISLDLKKWAFYYYFATFLLIWNCHQLSNPKL